MSGRINKQSFLGRLMGELLLLFGRLPARPAPEDLSRADFKAGMQRVGVRFTDKIRDVFRFKWLRKL